jgi:hypothetical protein
MSHFYDVHNIKEDNRFCPLLCPTHLSAIIEHLTKTFLNSQRNLTRKQIVKNDFNNQMFVSEVLNI